MHERVTRGGASNSLVQDGSNFSPPRAHRFRDFRLGVEVRKWHFSAILEGLKTNAFSLASYSFAGINNS